MVGRGDGNGIEVFVIECFTNILKALRGRPPFLFDHLPARFEQAPVGIDEMGDLTAFQTDVLFDVGLALPVNPCRPDTNHIIRTQHLSGRFCSSDGEERKHGARRCSGSEKLPSVGSGHRLAPVRAWRDRLVANQGSHFTALAVTEHS